MVSVLARALAARSPFFYGWIVLGCAMCAAFARQAAAVATLSVFIVPMTTEFAWSRAEISGAVALGGVLAAIVSPGFGALVDRSGARAVLTLSTVAIAATALSLAWTQTLLWFYVAFSLGRMLFASPFDIGMSAAVANWFVRRRALAMSGVQLSTGVSLAIMPFIAQLAIDANGWRAGWVTVAIAVLVVGALPNALLMARRPEDLGLRPDGDVRPPAPGAGTAKGATSEPGYTLRAALRTPALWLLMAFTALVFPVQAGISLHQAPHLIERGIDPTIAASVVSTFAGLAALGGLAFGVVAGRWPVRHGLALGAGVSAIGALLMHGVADAADGYVAAALFGAGIGGVLTLVPVSFADYFGRASYGAIRGVALPVQVLGQAAGPLLAGLMRDATGSYDAALATFTGLAIAAAVLALLARPPGHGAPAREP